MIFAICGIFTNFANLEVKKNITSQIAKINIRMKANFECDYATGAHPDILKALVSINDIATSGYGHDPFCEKAKERIRRSIGREDADIYFAVGGTQTNSLVIDGLLRPYQCVVAAETSHINVHEAGAIEADGHKVWVVASDNGKLTAKGLEESIDRFYSDETWPHMPIPGMVYITFPTELGTIYSKSELTSISAVCKMYKLPLFIDGARLGYGLAAPSCDVTLKDIAAIADVFYIGGTKQGLLMGEAIVARKGLLPHFFTLMKQHGAVLAKGRVLGIQFDALFSNDLFFRISRHAVGLAMKLRDGFIAKWYNPEIDSYTNQQFFTLPNELIEKLKAVATFDYWGAPGPEESTIRFVTSWSTTDEDVENLLKHI